MTTLERLGVGDVAPATWRAAAFHGVFVGAVVTLKSSTNALYLANRPPEGLAALYVAVAVLMALTTAALAGPLSGRSPRRQLAFGAWFSVAAVAILVALHVAGFPQALAPLYVLGELYATTLSILFWSSVSGWFDARSARRAYAIISAGGMAGSLVGGILTRPLAFAVGASGMAVFGVVLVAGALGLLAGKPAQAPQARSTPQSVGGGARYLFGRRYPQAVAALAAAISALGACVDYVFRIESAARLSELELATLFGDLNAAVGAAAILFQLFITNRLLDRGGLFVFLAVIPTTLAVLGMAAGITQWFSLLILLKGVEMGGSYSILQSGMQLLYNPVPVESRPAVRAFIDGLVKKGGMALAGVLLGLAGTLLPRAQSAWLVLVPAVASLMLIRVLRKAYLVALEEKLRGSRARVALTLDVVDRATRTALTRALDSNDAGDVLAALELLKRDPTFKPQDHLVTLLTHAEESVRLAAMELVPDHPSPQVEFALASILSLDERRPRAGAARVLARVRPERAAQALRPYLHDADPGVACAVVAALLRVPETTALADARLTELLAHQQTEAPALRRELARLMGDLPLERAARELPTFLETADNSVRALALQSAARILERAVKEERVPQVTALVPVLQRRLGHRQDRPLARLAITRLGSEVVPTLRATLDDRSIPLAVRIEVPRLFRLIGTQSSMDALLYSNIREHPSLRWRIAEALYALHREHPELTPEKGRVFEAAQRRLAAFATYRPLCHQLAAADATAPRGGPARQAWDLLRRATRDRLTQNLTMALHILGLVGGHERMDRAARALVDAELKALEGVPLEQLASARADALEVVDVALQGEDARADILAALEPPPPSKRDDNVPWADMAQTAKTLRASQDPLLAALAQKVLRSGVIGLDESSMPHGVLPTPQPAVGDPTDTEEVTSMDETTLNRILTLEKVDLFEGMPVDDLAAISAIAEERRAAAGEVLYREGDRGDAMMVIVSGRVDLLRNNQPFMELGPGESLGQVSLLDRGPRPTTAVVSSNAPALLLSIGCDAFLDLVVDRPDLTRGLFVVLAKRLRALIDLQAGKKDAAR
jgi:hypothetical protein